MFGESRLCTFFSPFLQAKFVVGTAENSTFLYMVTYRVSLASIKTERHFLMYLWNNNISMTAL